MLVVLHVPRSAPAASCGSTGGAASGAGGSQQGAAAQTVRQHEEQQQQQRNPTHSAAQTPHTDCIKDCETAPAVGPQCVQHRHRHRHRAQAQAQAQVQAMARRVCGCGCQACARCPYYAKPRPRDAHVASQRLRPTATHIVNREAVWVLRCQGIQAVLQDDVARCQVGIHLPQRTHRQCTV